MQSTWRRSSSPRLQSSFSVRQKNRLNKFYNPAVYKAPPKKEMSMEDKIVAAGTSALTQSEMKFDTDDDAASFVQIKSHVRVAPPEAPEATFGGKSKKSGGVIGLMDMMIGDLKMSLGEIKF